MKFIPKKNSLVLSIILLLSSFTVIANYKISIKSNPLNDKSKFGELALDLNNFSSCKAILDANSSATSGNFDITINGNAKNVFCDMDLDGGG
jgi:hypothetical protein